MDGRRLRQRRLPRALVCLLPVLACAAMGPGSVARGIEPRDRSTPISVSVRLDPPSARLTWPAEQGVQRYSVFRRQLGADRWERGPDLPGSARGVNDATVRRGRIYEYVVRTARLSASGRFTGSGVACVAVDAPLIEERGRLLLVVDTAVAGRLAGDLNVLQEDLQADGWHVTRLQVGRSERPEVVRARIRQEHRGAAGPLAAVYLLGHVPVPYSGSRAPDGHAGHAGAWPADVFYADIAGEWTDRTVDIPAEDRRPANRPGDGKWDQDRPPGTPELMVGRVDFYNLPCLRPADEGELLRRYLERAHRYRHGWWRPDDRAVVVDRFGDRGGESFAAGAWRGFHALLGPQRVAAAGDWPTGTSGPGMLAAYGCAIGSFHTCRDVLTSERVASEGNGAAIGLLFGSWFGDWDSRNNLLRAALAAPGRGLATGWSGRPHWLLHPLAAGETTGFCVRLTQAMEPFDGLSGAFTRGVHVALMGDPAIRLRMPAPPREAETTRGPDGTDRITWKPSADAVAGYHVYDVSSPVRRRRLTKQPVRERAFLWRASGGGGIYRVMAVRREQTTAGSYWNGSLAVLARRRSGDRQ